MSRNREFNSITRFGYKESAAHIYCRRMQAGSCLSTLNLGDFFGVEDTEKKSQSLSYFPRFFPKLGKSGCGDRNPLESMDLYSLRESFISKVNEAAKR